METYQLMHDPVVKAKITEMQKYDDMPLTQVSLFRRKTKGLYFTPVSNWMAGKLCVPMHPSGRSG